MKQYSDNQLQRYPIYLKLFTQLAKDGVEYISSPKIAKELGFSEEQIRKDLQAVCDEPGIPKKGREVLKLIETLEEFLGYKDTTNAILIGAGHLGGAIMNYPNFDKMGFNIAAAVDVDERKHFTEIQGKTIYPVDKLEELLSDNNTFIVIITVPGKYAQEVADYAIKCGAKAIWNFAPIHLTVPQNIVVEDVNLASSLAVLSHRVNEMKYKSSKKSEE